MTRYPVGMMALHTDTPDLCVTQEDLAEQFAIAMTDNPRRQQAMKRIFNRTGVRQRHMSASPMWLATERTTQERNDVYMEQAVPLGERTIRDGLRAYGLSAEQANEFYAVSCTGLSIPGLDLHLAGRLGMRHDLRRTCILGMGCYGSFPALRRAHDAVKARPDERALMLSVELCSLHVQHNETTENVVSTGLFADGAGMVMLGETAAPGLPYIVDFEVYSNYQTLDKMSFELSDTGFIMYLSGYVPDILAAHATEFVDTFLSKHDLTRADVAHWGIHPGSTKIVDYIQQELGLADEQVAPSHAVLAENGNMSSATILFVLERICRDRTPQPGEYAMLMAFGPGLTVEAMLVRW